MHTACRRAVPAVLVAFAAVALVAADTVTPKAARHEFAQLEKAAIQQFRSDLVVAAAPFKSALATFDDAVSAGTSTDDDVDALFTALDAMQSTIEDATNAAAQDFGGSLSQPLASLSGGSDLGGHYPKGFYSGDGGTLDRFRTDAQDALDQHYGELNKRLKKTGKLLQQHGLRFTWLMHAPVAPRATAANQNSESSVTITPLGIDCAFSISNADADDDGRVWAAGAAAFTYGNVTFNLAGAGSFNDTIAPSVSERWLASAAGGALPEGNYLIDVRQNAPNPGPRATVAFGVR